jgi:hypothetical protein
MEKEVTWTKDWPGANRRCKSISTFHKFRDRRIEEVEALDIRTQGVPKPEIPISGKGRSPVEGREQVRTYTL